MFWKKKIVKQQKHNNQKLESAEGGADATPPPLNTPLKVARDRLCVLMVAFLGNDYGRRPSSKLQLQGSLQPVLGDWSAGCINAARARLLLILVVGDSEHSQS